MAYDARISWARMWNSPVELSIQRRSHACGETMVSRAKKIRSTLRIALQCARVGALLWPPWNRSNLQQRMETTYRSTQPWAKT